MRTIFVQLLGGFAAISLLTLLVYVWCAGCAPTLNRTDQETVIRFSRLNAYPYDWFARSFQANRLHSDSAVDVRFEEEYIMVGAVMFQGRWVSPSLFEADGYYDYSIKDGDMDSGIIFRIGVQPDVLKIALDTSLIGSGLERFEGSYKIPLKY